MRSVTDHRHEVGRLVGRRTLGGLGHVDEVSTFRVGRGQGLAGLRLGSRTETDGDAGQGLAELVRDRSSDLGRRHDPGVEAGDEQEQGQAMRLHRR